ncbi:MAG: hypothetical protein K0R90_1501 [Oscillospiraceae bacterium]|jgi:hypothetical protein|nr:hypothetical protein [Oscillospiraceae bacterium]
MKKTFSVLIMCVLLLTLVSCNRPTQYVDVASFHFESSELIEDKTITKTSDFVTDKEIAINVAKAFVSEREYKKIDVSYDDKSAVWLVSFMPDKNIVGGSTSVYISRDGKILMVKLGE